MSRAVMHRHAPGAQPLGVARLVGHRFVITTDGYASVTPACGQTVHGVVWRLATRDRVTLDTWENIAAGRYRVEHLPIWMHRRRMPALVYIARSGAGPRPRPGYMELVTAAAREWELPTAYLQVLWRWSSPRWSGNAVPFKGPGS